MGRLRLVGAGFALTVLAVPLAAEDGGSTAPPVPKTEWSAIAPLAAKSLLLDAQLAGKRVVAVGERGHVLLSDDNGTNWRQAKVPSRATLTGVWFHDEKLGWAVGHDEVVLRSEDGGENWSLMHSAPQNLWPLLDVWFRDASHGIAVGAYGKYLETADGGRTWQDRVFEPVAAVGGGSEPADAAIGADEDQGDDGGGDLTVYTGEADATDMHLNAIVALRNGAVLLVGETGAVFRSDDQGANWRRLPSPYDGSFFGGLELAPDNVLLFGLRGNLFRSDDGGAQWRALTTGTLAMLTDALRLADGTVILVGMGGTVLLSRDSGETFQALQQPDRKGLQRIVPAGADFLLFGEGGVRRFELPIPAR